MWGTHIKEVLIQSQTQAEALDRLSKSTWGTFFTSARRLYTVIIWSLMIYCASVWVSTLSIVQKLSPAQNKCLWAIVSVYKATSIPELETEIFISLINLYFRSVLESSIRESVTLCINKQERSFAHKFIRRLDVIVTSQS